MKQFKRIISVCLAVLFLLPVAAPVSYAENIVYHVRLEGGKESEAEKVFDVTAGESIQLPAYDMACVLKMYRKAYRLKDTVNCGTVQLTGWMDEDDRIFSGAYTPTEDVTLYAVWETITKTVPDVTIEPENGNVCVGWSTQEGDTQVRYFSGDSITLSKPTTELYAVWMTNAEAERIISLNAMGGTVSPIRLTGTLGSTVTLPQAAKSITVTFDGNGGVSAEPNRSLQCAFLGWSESAGSTTARYSAGDTYRVKKAGTLFALWGGSKIGTLPTAQSEEYQFKGWSTTADGSVDVTSETVFSADTTLYAQWNICEHSFDQITRSPSCTESGISYSICSKCGFRKNVIQTPALGHDYSAQVTTEPTCTAEGVRTYTCTRCQDTYTEPVQALGHDYGSEVTTEPTCEAEGLMTYTCTRCEDSYTDPIQALGHDYSFAVTKDATCKETGLMVTTCTRCDYRRTDVVERLDHTPQVVEEPADCLQDGRRYTKCAVCGTILSEIEVLPKSGHRKGSPMREDEIPATCTENGQYYDVTRCENCGLILSRSPIVSDALGHDYVPTVTRETNCFRAGELTYICSRCGDSYTEEIPKLPHTPENLTDEPTCAQEGRQYTQCAVCGEILSETTLPMIAHTPYPNYEYFKTEPTCTQEGQEDWILFCQVCGEEIDRSTNVIDPLGHVYSDSDFRYNGDATTEHDGTETAACQRCGEPTTRIAVGTRLNPIIHIHNYVPVRTVDYRTTITFYLDPVENPVSGAQVHWFVDGVDQGVSDIYTAKRVKQSFEIQAKYYRGSTLLAESAIETVEVTRGFGAWLKAFFRALVGRLPTILQDYLGVERTVTDRTPEDRA